MFENVLDLKKRIETVQGIFSIDQTLIWNGKELHDMDIIGNLTDNDQLFLIVKPPQKKHRFQLHINKPWVKSDLSLYGIIESEEPITLKDYK
jgi:hypothetical protein